MLVNELQNSLPGEMVNSLMPEVFKVKLHAFKEDIPKTDFRGQKNNLCSITQNVSSEEYNDSWSSSL